jgi:hypothetical protein
LTDAAARAALLEYRSLLRAYFNVPNINQRLFELAVGTLLKNIPVAIAGGREKTIGQLCKEFQASRPRYRTRPALRRLAEAEKAFNDGFGAVLPDIEKRTSEFLAFFVGTGLELKLALPGVRFDAGPRLSRDRKFIGTELEATVRLHGVELSEWNDLLNEARLSALALSLYLAGAVLGNPAPPASVGTPLQLLVLDDVLIGLDLANRLTCARPHSEGVCCKGLAGAAFDIRSSMVRSCKATTCVGTLVAPRTVCRAHRRFREAVVTAT